MRTPDLSHLECMDDIFAFVRDVMVFSLSDGKAADRLRFVLREDERYNAGVLVLSPARFGVFMNTATATRLFEFCGAYGASDNPYMRDHVVELEALSVDPDQALAISYYAGLIFVSMHEYAHVAAGHLAYDRATFGDGPDRPLSFTELEGATERASSGRRSGPEYRRFRRISELEADGVAFALVMDFAQEIAMLARIEPEPWDAYDHAVHRAVLLGCLAALCLLEGLFAQTGESGGDGEYPFPGMRIINLCSSYFRVVDPDAVVWRGEDYRTRILDAAQVDRTTAQYTATIAPALIILNDALVRRGMETRLLGAEPGESMDDTTLFMRDILAVLGGRAPVWSPDGRLLTELSDSRAHFVLALEPYRELDLWPTH